MSVRYRGVTHRITYIPGPDGLDHFLATLQSIGIKVASASQVTFLCRSPDTGEEMALKGLKAFDAAAYCASITAAKRKQRDTQRRQRATSSGSDCGVAAEATASGGSSPRAGACVRPCLDDVALHRPADAGRQAAGVHAPQGAAAAHPQDGPRSPRAGDLPVVVVHHNEAAQAGGEVQPLEHGAHQSAPAPQHHCQTLPRTRWQRLLSCIPSLHGVALNTTQQQ